MFIARRGRSELTTTILAPGELADLVERMLRTSGRRIDMSTPFVDATMPDGSRLHVVIPDITRRHMAVNIRKFVLRPLARRAGRAGHAHRAGGPLPGGGGRRGAQRARLRRHAGREDHVAQLPGRQRSRARERVITCEEVFELRVPLPDVVSMQTRQPNLEGAGEIPLRRLVKEALRMRPSRIVVGEVRQEECLDLLIALNTGFPE